MCHVIGNASGVLNTELVRRGKEARVQWLAAKRRSRSAINRTLAPNRTISSSLSSSEVQSRTHG